MCVFYTTYFYLQAYRNNVLTTVKLIAQDDEDVASDLEADKDNAIDKLINTLAIQSILDENPVGLLIDAFSWKDSPEGAEYWENITKEFAERHPMIGSDEEDN